MKTNYTCEWISTKERFPEINEKVLICQENREINIGTYNEYHHVWFKGDINGVGGSDVIAWMPLPKPFIRD